MSADEITTIHKRLDSQDAVLHEIRSAIVGNAAMGNPGIAHRLKEVEDHAKAVDRKLLTWGGIVTGAVFVAEVFIKKLNGGG